MTKPNLQAAIDDWTRAYGWTIRISEEIGLNVMSLSWECAGHEPCDTASMLRIARVESYSDALRLVLTAIIDQHWDRSVTLLPGTVTEADRILAIEAFKKMQIPAGSILPSEGE